MGLTKHIHDLQRRAWQTLSCPSTPWRHHGVGMLQAYLTPSHRLHVWHPDLLVDGMTESGALHDHRFDLHSTILTGCLFNSEIKPSLDGKTFSIWEIPRASAGKSSELRRVGNMNAWIDDAELLKAGDTHALARRAFHWARPADGICVSSVLVMNKHDTPARLLCHPDQAPVHAFAFRPNRALIDRVKLEARRQLKSEQT